MKFNSAKYLLAAVGALSFTSYSAVHGQEAGMNCPISSKVWCKLDNGDDCETLEETDFRPDTCGPRRITMYYEYCNLKDSNNVRPIEKKTVAKFRNEIINIDLEKNTDMRGNGCRTATYTTVIDNCDIIWVTGDLKFEGNRLDSNNEIIVAWDPNTKQSNEDYCYAYDIYKKRVVSKDQAPTGPGLPYPKPDIDVAIECEVESTPGNGFYNSSCQKIPMDSSLQCLRDVKYTYTVRNTGTFDAILHSAIDIERKNILEGGSAIVAAGTSWSKEEFKQVDVCKDAGKIIKKDLSAVAVPQATPDSSPAALASSTYQHILPTFSPYYSYATNNCAGQGCISHNGIFCVYNGKDCNDYIKENGCFAGEVELIYNPYNAGNGCHDITQATSRINGVERALAFNGGHSCDDRRSCPGEFFEFTQMRYFDFCKFNGDIDSDLEIDTTGGSTTVPLSFTIIRNDGVDVTLPPAPKPTPSPVAPTPTNMGECKDHPSQLWLTFNPRTCKESSNSHSQFIVKRNLRGLKHNSSGSKTKKSKYDKDDKDKKDDGGDAVTPEYMCQDYKTFGYDPKVEIRITSIDGTIVYTDMANVCDGTEMVIGNGSEKIAYDIKIQIYEKENLYQEIVMHTACATQAMSLNDIFGSIQVTGIKDAKQGLLGK